MKVELIKGLKHKMPTKPSTDEMLDEESLEFGEEMPAEEASPAASLSDEELLAEVKKRNLKWDDEAGMAEDMEEYG